MQRTYYILGLQIFLNSGDRDIHIGSLTHDTLQISCYTFKNIY